MYRPARKRPEDRELRLFELSVRTARLFREYAISRAAMLSAMADADRRPSSTRCARASAGSAIFTCRFSDPTIAWLPRWIASGNSRFFLLTSALAAIAPDKLCVRARPSRCIFLAFPTPVPSSPAFLRTSVKLTELHVYALNPCMEFWEDVEGACYRAAIALSAADTRSVTRWTRADDPFSLDAPGENAALRQWGKPGREYIRLLNELTDCDFDSHFEPPPPARGSSLLARVQESILCREPEASATAPAGALRA